jgi:NADH-quinone oxidoreductase subunit C
VAEEQTDTTVTAPDAADEAVEAQVDEDRDGIVASFRRELGDDLTVDSWVPVYAGADWHEREAWEMFGVTFTGHPGLRHMYLPSDFEGHPMRKEFPLLARMVKPWPGIVDVEQMPGDDDEAAADESGDAS